MAEYNQFAANTESSAMDDASALSLQDILSLVINHWKWFVLSAVLFVLAGTYYALRITPTYSRSAKVLIKEDRKNSSPSIMDVSSSFSNMGFGTGRVNVDNEMHSFRSPDLMLEVVRNLNLDVNYRTKGLFHDNPLYGNNLPVTVSFLSVGFNERAALKVSPADSGYVYLSNFVLGENKNEEKVIRVAYGDTTATPAGNVVVRRNLPPEVLDLTEPVMVTRSGYRSAAARCGNRLTAALADKNSTVILLTYTDESIQRADDILWMIINVYNENWIKDKNLVSTSTNEFITERLRIIEQELGSVDQSITTFRSEHRLPSSNVVSTEMQISTQTSQKIVELNNQLTIARMLRSDIVSAPVGALLPANVGLNDASTASQITQYNNGALQRKRLVESSSEDNLLVKDLDTLLISLRGSIINSLDTYLKSVDIQVQSAQQVQRTSDARVSNIPIQAGQLLSDERQQKVKESLYLFLLQKREENELSQAFTAYTTKIIASPGGSSRPVAPRKNVILLVAFFLGLAIPFAYFYLKTALNTTIRGRKDLENHSAPILGELPSIEKRKHFTEKVMERLRKKPDPDQENREIVVKPHSRDIINEAFRVVRTNLEFMHGKEAGSKVLMVSSFNAGSGKTFVSTNLSATLAVKNKKVIVVDLDLRKRTLSMLAGKPRKGITDYLSGKTDDYHSLIVKGVGGSSLNIMPVGMMPPNPAELLAEPRLAQMLAELREEYDYIFLDCPPIQIVTDADVVAPLADVTIFVVRAGLFERAMLPEIDKFYASKRYNNLCLLLNATEGAGHYGYRYGYRYGYAYGKYGYSNSGSGEYYGN